jgi:multiple antibiotic resistance protein
LTADKRCSNIAPAVGRRDMDHSWPESFLLTFVPLFIVIDALGNLPIIISLSEGMSPGERRKMINIAIITAAIVGLIFLFFGRFILELLDISVGSFAIAGGIVLLVLSIKLIVTGHMVDVVKEEMVAIVPIGTPLLVGPATITTLLLLVNQFPLYLVLLSFALNILIAWIMSLLSNWITGFMGQGGLKAVSKVFSLLLAAIAVSMVIQGLSMLGILNIKA